MQFAAKQAARFTFNLIFGCVGDAKQQLKLDLTRRPSLIDLPTRHFASTTAQPAILQITKSQNAGTMAYVLKQHLVKFNEVNISAKGVLAVTKACKVVAYASEQMKKESNVTVVCKLSFDTGEAHPNEIPHCVFFSARALSGQALSSGHAAPEVAITKHKKVDSVSQRLLQHLQAGDACSIKAQCPRALTLALHAMRSVRGHLLQEQHDLAFQPCVVLTPKKQPGVDVEPEVEDILSQFVVMQHTFKLLVWRTPSTSEAPLAG